MPSVQFNFRALDDATWPPDGRTRYKSCVFSAGYDQTLRELSSELQRIGVKEAVIEADFIDRRLRVDGQLRHDARMRTPRLRLSFTHPATGPLQYPCDTFENWQDNLRAICKTLEAQRAMDRYGATRRNQQYAGWKMLPGRIMELGGITPEAPMPLAEAVQLIIKFAGLTDDTQQRERIARTYGVYRDAYRAAVRRVHPDVGGNAEDFQQTIRAKVTLDRHHGLEA